VWAAPVVQAAAYNPCMANAVTVGIEIHSDSKDARKLVDCVFQRLTGHPMVDLDDRPDVLMISVHAESGVDMPAGAERLRDECAAELKIGEPWRLVSVLRSTV
jgi:hypothetical protein